MNIDGLHVYKITTLVGLLCHLDYSCSIHLYMAVDTEVEMGLERWRGPRTFESSTGPKPRITRSIHNL